MQVTRDAVVVIHYTLTNDVGEVLDSSAGGEPLAYIHGGGSIINGLEEALEGKAAGDRLAVVVPAEKAYGSRDARLVEQVPKRAFQGVGEIKAGMRFTAQTEQGVRQVVVTRVVGDMVTVDGNHPLAGQTLNFDIQIAEVRAATAEELAHGHVHGAGGHHHHE
ncbi:MAG TPA: peptidylprolyl isomerase [Steroidobacteraceae bacterium]|nr:peptidylprolyl isomerase [Steroidobacteraceae bacterium]